MPLRTDYNIRGRFTIPTSAVWLPWAVHLACHINHALPNKRYIAHLNIHGGSDPTIASDTESVAVNEPDRIAHRWVCFDAYRPPECELRIKDREANYELVGMVELVGETTKARSVERTRFLAKCVSNLTAGIGVGIVDASPYPGPTLHHELLTLLGAPAAADLPSDVMFAASYRMEMVDEHPMVSTCSHPLEAGRPIPPLPLILKGGLEVMLDLEAAYMQALADLRL